MLIINKIILITLLAVYVKAEKLVDVQNVIPDIDLDLKYATENNFTKAKIYTKTKCYLLEHVAKALKQVNDKLKKQGYKLKIFDGYRPMDAQRKMWSIFPDPKYVSDPNKEFGRHTRGTTVDVTLIKLDGSDVEMPTEFDAFEEKAHSNYQDLSEQILKNRKLLQDAMVEAGFNTINVNGGILIIKIGKIIHL